MQISYSSSIRGIYDAITLLNKGAEKVNRDKIAEGMVDMHRAVRQAQANIAVLRVSDRMTKSLLDIYG